MSGKNSHDKSLEHLDITTSNAVSSGDFTGLIPANPESVDNEAYEQIYENSNDEVKKIMDKKR